MAWMFLYIGNDPKVQSLIYEEQVALFGNVKTSPSQTDLRKMEYLERVIKECVSSFKAFFVIKSTQLSL